MACWATTSGNNLCRLVYDVTGSPGLAEWADTLIARPFAILMILVGAVLVRWLVHRAIDRLAARAASGSTPGILNRGKVPISEIGPLSVERRSQRLSTMASLLKSIATGIIFSIAVLMAIAELGYNIAPLIASAGILGVALGFGSQALVKDFLSGLFMIIEDQYGVGDVVDLGEADGVVETVGLRVTRLRSVDGTVWYVRNGEIVRVGNMSYGWSRAVLDIGVAYGEDTGKVRNLLGEVAHELAVDEAWSDLILEEPEVWGVEQLGADGVVIRLVLKTKPLEQWKVARELRERIKHRFDAEGVEIPFPQRTLWVRDEGPDATDPEESEPVAAVAGATRRESSDQRREPAQPDSQKEQRAKATRSPAPEAEAGPTGGGSRG